MKKRLIIAITTLLFLTGCSNESGTVTCSRTLNQNGVKMDLHYEIEYTGKYADKLTSTEKIISSSSETLEIYKTSIEKTYELYKDIENYETSVSIDGDTLTSTVKADYTKIDLDKLVAIDSANEQLIENGKIKLDNILTIYEGMGIICKK